ncbi:DUF4355 domain-containing protein [Faecalicatena contorta]|uniref:capsid assembly scaffolding protein Gp46 family protein n=1 Tax=Faecalicatena contorta TaxID=39482 RepID=UPI001961E2FD|nr:DUF4355 domain-containing protein [Faecalicatena contorta]MBM6686796.1 DUF4355 domain-containing protein [Faecalicatena contorta]MBM6709693.1 DUF4355 domain-containing protein [Faecalicatena contorta]
MSEFKTIETQEQLDAIIADRIKRAQETTRKEFEGFLSPEDAEKKYAGYLSPEAEKKKYAGYLSPEEAAKKDAKIKGYETNSVKMRIAHENGIPYELAERLNGDTEDDIRKDAETMAKYLKKQQGGAPLASTEPSDVDSKRAAVKKMLSGLKEE